MKTKVLLSLFSVALLAFIVILYDGGRIVGNSYGKVVGSWSL
jgi:hypothetical protein